MINVILVAPPSIVQIGYAATIRKSENIQLIATVDRLDLLETIIDGLTWDVMVILPHKDDVIPQIIKQAGNVVCLSYSGALAGTPASDLSTDAVIHAIKAAYAHKLATAHLGAAAAMRDEIKAFNLKPRQKPIVNPPSPFEGLSSHQREVLSLLSKGLTNREIAEILKISVPTARYHVSAIFSKLGVSNRTEAASLVSYANGPKDGAGEDL